MLTVISGNNRNGYPCALNTVGDILPLGIPPFETEGLADLGEASQKGGFPLAGLRGQMLGSVKVTASGGAGVTVSMTSGESKTSGKYDSGSYLSSPESGSAKYRQRRSTKVGACPDNLLNRKAESAFVQASGKEKGPAVSQALLSTSMISGTGESNELHHNSHLQATGNLSYSHNQHPNKTGAGLVSPIHEADISRYRRFFYVRYNQRCAPIMVGRSGGALALAGFFVAGLTTPLRLASLLVSRDRGLKEPTKEAATMATAYTRPEFIDTYWIIPEYETTPYGKVSFTRQDRRTFIAMFKDSHLIWAGRQPVNGFTENVKRTESPKLPVEGIEEISTPPRYGQNHPTFNHNEHRYSSGGGTCVNLAPSLHILRRSMRRYAGLLWPVRCLASL